MKRVTNKKIDSLLLKIIVCPLTKEPLVLDPIKNELISKHKIIKKINKKLSIFCSPGHFISFNNLNKKEEIKLKKFLFRHQIKKKFQYSLEWEKNQLAIWDNRSMIHQATPFKGNRIMHRITIY